MQTDRMLQLSSYSRPKTRRMIGVAFRMTTVRSCTPAGIREPRSGLQSHRQSRLTQASRKTAQQFFSDRNFVMAAIRCPERLIEFALRKTHDVIYACAGAP